MPVGKKCWSRLSVDAATGQMLVDEFLLCSMGVFAKRERRSRIEPPYEGAPPFIPVPISRGAILWRKVRDVTVNRTEGIITVHGNRDSRVALYSSGDTVDEILAWIDDALEQNPLLLDADAEAALWIEWGEEHHWKKPYESLESMVQSELRHGRFVDRRSLERTVISAPGAGGAGQPFALFGPDDPGYR